MPHGRKPVPHPGQQRLKDVVDQQSRTLGIGQPEHDLGRCKAGVDRHENKAAPGKAEETLQVAVAVERQNANPVAGLVTQLGQRASQPGRPGRERKPVLLTASIHCRQALRIRLNGSAQELRYLRHGASPDPIIAGFRQDLTSGTTGLQQQPAHQGGVRSCCRSRHNIRNCKRQPRSAGPSEDGNASAGLMD